MVFAPKNTWIWFLRQKTHEYGFCAKKHMGVFGRPVAYTTGLPRAVLVAVGTSLSVFF